MNIVALFSTIITVFGIISGLIFIIFAKQLEKLWVEKYPSCTQKGNRVGGIVMLCLSIVLGVLAFIAADMTFSADIFTGKGLLIMLGGVALMATFICFVIGVGSNKISDRARTVFNIVTIISFLLCIVFFTLGFTDMSESSTKDIYGNTEAGVYVAVKDAVRDSLKSPSSAEFCPISEATFSLSDKTWTVTGWVDAQNSFGATLRNEFKVVITFTGSTSYTVDLCSIN